MATNIPHAVPVPAPDASPQQEPSPFPELADERYVGLAGDWHSNILWIEDLIPRLAAAVPGLHVLLHLGDLNFNADEAGHRLLDTIDRACATAGITHVLLTPGGHDDWAELDRRFRASPGAAVRLSKVVWALPRGFRFTIGGARFLSFGGAVSLDHERRTAGVDWWPELERPTRADMEAAVAAGRTDVLLTHEPPSDGIPAVTDILDAPSSRWPVDARARAGLTQLQITRLLWGVMPSVMVHGHVHVGAHHHQPDGASIYSLDRDGHSHSAGFLHLRTLRWRWFEQQQTRSAAAHPVRGLS